MLRFTLVSTNQRPSNKKYLGFMRRKIGDLSLSFQVHLQEMFCYQIKVPIILFHAIFDDLKNIYDRIDHEHINFEHHSDTHNKVRYLSISGKDSKQVFCFFGEL